MTGMRVTAWLACVLLLAGCASAHYYKLPHADVIGPCQASVPEHDLMIGVALSGGGSRAALFAEAGLEALAQIRLADGASLIDRIDHISSVSGGSLSASYYILKKPGRGVAVLNPDGAMSPAYRTFFDQYRADLSQDEKRERSGAREAVHHPDEQRLDPRATERVVMIGDDLARGVHVLVLGVVEVKVRVFVPVVAMDVDVEVGARA